MREEKKYTIQIDIFFFYWIYWAQNILSPCGNNTLLTWWNNGHKKRTNIFFFSFRTCSIYECCLSFGFYFVHFGWNLWFMAWAGSDQLSSSHLVCSFRLCIRRTRVQLMKNWDKIQVSLERNAFEIVAHYTWHEYYNRMKISMDKAKDSSGKSYVSICLRARSIEKWYGQVKCCWCLMPIWIEQKKNGIVCMEHFMLCNHLFANIFFSLSPFSRSLWICYFFFFLFQTDQISTHNRKYLLWSFVRNLHSLTCCRIHNET